MAKLIIKGIVGLDGEYEIATPPWTKREWHEIKAQTGLRPAEWDDAFENGDQDLLVSLAAITLTRAGINKRQAWDTMWDTDDEDARIQIIPDEEPEEEEDDAGPPVQQSNSEDASETVSPESPEPIVEDSGESTNPHVVPSGLLPYLVSTGDQA